MNHLSFEDVNMLISEIYPFTFQEVSKYQDTLNFLYLSKNKRLKWNYKIISEFENKWDWESLDKNKSIFNTLTLSLFFSERVDTTECNCFRQEKFCEYENCLVNTIKFSSAKSSYDIYPEQFVRILWLIESGFIDSKMINDFYLNKDLEILKINYNM